MQIEIQRQRMAIAPRDDGMIAVSYRVLVPEEDVLPGAQGVIRLQHYDGRFREYRSYEDATWVTDLPRSFERYAKWLNHEENAQREMLAMVKEHCPETRQWSQWPVFWAYVDAGASLETIRFTIEQPKEPETAAAAVKTAEPPAA